DRRAGGGQVRQPGPQGRGNGYVSVRRIASLTGVGLSLQEEDDIMAPGQTGPHPRPTGLGDPRRPLGKGGPWSGCMTRNRPTSTARRPAGEYDGITYSSHFFMRIVTLLMMWTGLPWSV